jgi:DNA-binding CsgD family transcriptional regulator
VDARGQLLDLIYQTVLEPQRWVTVMERIADSIGGTSGCLTRLNVESGNGTAIIARNDPVWLQLYQDYYGRLNIFTVQTDPLEYRAAWRPNVTTEFDYLSRDELLRHEYYNDYMLPAGVDGALMISLDLTGFDVSAVNIHRTAKREPFGPEDLSFVQSLQPHLIRAYRLGQELQNAFAHAESHVAALNQMGKAVVVVDARSRIRHTNMAADSLMRARKGLAVVGGRLTAMQPATARRLEALIGAAADPDLPRGGSMDVPAGARTPLSVTVAPFAARPSPVFADGPSVLITIADAQADEDLLRRKLEDLFALTAAEIRVALALLAGATPRDAAHRFDVSVNTVRSQMASIFAKTETSGQAELSRLLVRLANRP